MRTAIVVGAGAGGAAAARELQGKFQVTVVEEGRSFRPLNLSLGWMEGLKRSGLVFDERQIQLFFPAMKIYRLPGQVLVRGRGEGGTTTISCGNALRLDGDLKALGIDLEQEFAALEREVPVTTDTQRLWHEPTRRFFTACEEMGLDPRPLPKMGRYELCAGCGRCVLGCPRGVKWDSREFLRDAEAKGARMITGCRVERVVLEGGRAVGITARLGGKRRFFPADLVILAAGGLGTPVILEKSGLLCEKRLFVDPVLTVAAPWPGARQGREMPMPFMVQRDRYIISPYFDYLSYIFNRSWRNPADDVAGLMIKLADEPTGAVGLHGIDKPLTAGDEAALREGIELCRELFLRCGIGQDRIFLGTLNAGHPGGSLPLTEREAATLHHDRLPYNLYVADATLLPRSLGAPPILTVMALAMKVAKAAMIA